MYVLLLVLQLLASAYSQGLFNYTSGLALPLSCPSDMFPVTSTGAFIDVPAGASGVQIQQVVYGHRAAAPPMLDNVSIGVYGYMGEVNVPSTVKNCCTANGCDLANYALYSSGSWFEAPICGQQSACGPPVQWYSLNFENTPVGTCAGCGIIGTGNIDMTIDFQGTMVVIPDYGLGGSIYVSYYGIFPPSPTPTTSISPSETGSMTESGSESVSVSVSASETASVSMTGTVSPSETESTSETASVTASSSVSASETATSTTSSTETPSPVSPSTSPSVTVSVSVTKSVTPSRSPSRSPVGVCNHARAMLYGKLDGVIEPSGPSYYYVFHGVNVSHVYSPNYMLMGKNPTCSETATTCTCVYTQGDSAVCGFPRQTTVTYTYGSQTQTTFIQQNPTCIYYFSTTLNIVSPTPSPSISPSMSPSVSPSASPIDGVVELVADSTSDFQPLQGNNGWYYNYYNESMMINPFPDFGPNPLNVPNNWLISGSYCRINMNAIHSNSPYDCNSPSYGWCYPSLHWINSNYSYAHFIINIKASHTLYTPPGVDGVKLNISINNNQIDSYQTPFTVNKNYTAMNVTDIELVLDPINGCFSDKTDQNIKVYAYKPVMFSVTPSSSPSASVSPSRSKSASRSSTPSKTPSKSLIVTSYPSQIRSPIQTVSITLTYTATPLFFATAWPSFSSTPTRTPTRSAAYMMTPWPSKGYSASITESPRMYIVWYPSRSPSRLPDAVQMAIEEENKSENTAKIVGGIGVSIAALGLGAAGVQLLQGLNNAGQPRVEDNTDEGPKRNTSEDDNTKEDNTEENNTEEDNSKMRQRNINDLEDNCEQDEDIITRRPSLETHISEIDESTSKNSTTCISIPSNSIHLRRDRDNRDASGNTIQRKKDKEGPDYEPLISYFYYKKLQEHIHAENNTK